MTEEKKRNKHFITYIFSIVTLSIFTLLAIGGILFLYFNSTKKIQNEDYFLILSSSTGDNTAYVGECGKINVYLSNGNEKLELLKDGLTFTADCVDSNNSFITLDSSGSFEIKSRPSSGKIVFTVTFNSLTEEFTLDVLEINDIEKYKVTFEYKDPHDINKVNSISLNAIEGKKILDILDEDKNKQEIPSIDYGDFKYSWVVKGTDVVFNPLEEIYCWKSEITLEAKIEKKVITFIDEFNNTKQEFPNLEIAYGDELKDLKFDINELPEPKETEINGWKFCGWYPEDNSNFKNGLNNNKFVSLSSTLKAKWEGNATLDTTLPLKGETDYQNHISVVYNAVLNLKSLSEPEYDNGGEFIGWFIKDDTNKEILLTEETKYIFTDLRKIYAKIKFPVTFYYYNEKYNVGQDVYVMYNGSILDCDNILPTIEEKNGWHFVGWSTDRDVTDLTFKNDSIYNEAKVLELYSIMETSLSFYNELDAAGEALKEPELIATKCIYYGKDIDTSSLDLSKKAGEWEFNGYVSEDVRTDFLTIETDNEGNVVFIGKNNYVANGDLKLYAKWKTTISFNIEEELATIEADRQKLEVCYNANLSIPKDIVNYNEGIEGSQFTGWYEKEHGLGNRLVDGKPFEGKCNQVYYARTEFKVSFIDEKHNKKQEVNIIYGVSIKDMQDDKIKVDMPTYTDAYWSFAGWKSKDDDMIVYETTPYTITKSQDFYAVWSIKITYNADIGNIKNVFPLELTTQDFYYGADSSSLRTPSQQDSWKFAGWFTEQFGNGKAFNNQIITSNEIESIINPETKSIELYANWVADVSLNYGSGFTVPNGYPKSITLTYGRPSKLPTYEQLKQISERTGYNGGFWHTSKSEESEEITSSTENYPLSCETLYFLWRSDSNCIINFYYKDASGNKNYIGKVEDVIRGKNMPELSLDYKPNTNQPFLGYYYIDPKTNDKIFYYAYNEKLGISSLRLFDIIAEQIDFWADFGNSYKVTLDSGSVFGGTEYVYAVYEQDMPTGSNLLAPSRPGYNFLGYFDDQGKIFYNQYMESQSKWDKTSDTTLIAYWKYIPYTVSFNSNGGSNVNSINDIEYGSKIPQPNNPSRGGYSFTGWFKDSKCQQSWNFNKDIITSDTTLYAGWKKNCVASGTLITLSNGSQIPVEKLTGTEELLVWNFYTGKLDKAPILFIDSDEEADYQIINLLFSDNTNVKVISEHGFWDYNLNQWVFLREDASNYIGHWFDKLNSNGQREKVQLVDVKLTREKTTAWSPVTYGHLCYYVDGMLSMPGATEGFINIFEVDEATMKFDEYKMENDIQTFGTFSYDDFMGYIPEEIFNAFNGAYLKVAIGKKLITWDEILALITRYKDVWENE